MKKAFLVLLALFLLAVLAVIAISPLRQRAWQQINTWRADIFYALNPPEADVFVPEVQVAQAVQATLAALATPTALPSPTPTGAIQETTAVVSPTPTIEPTPLPAEFQLSGTKHEYQQWNNCGPATLSVALSFWGWQGDQRDTAGFIKPNPRDKNTSAYELVDYIEAETGLRALLRAGGDLDTLKRLVTAGFPVIIERGFDGYDGEGWMGHYQLVTGYSDSYGKVMTQDVLIMADFPVPYTELVDYWRAFNYVFVVIYPAEREAALLHALGPLADEAASYRIALERATQEAQQLSGRETFFAHFNRGTNLLYQEDMVGAAMAYDQAFAVYASLPEDQRPWRAVWYQHGPYPAYFSQGRYGDVISLADHTLSRTSEPALEESFYWRSQAKAAMGDNQGAIADLRSALQWKPGWKPALDGLAQLGAIP